MKSGLTLRKGKRTMEKSTTEDKNENMKIAQDFYLRTYGEEIVFDEVQQKGKYLIAVKKQEREKFLRTAGGVESEKNSAVFYFIDTSAGKDTKMVINSQGDKEIPSQHYSGYSNTEVIIFSGKDKIFNFSASNVYIDTNNIAQVSSLLSGKYPGAEYHSYSPEKNDLFLKWHKHHQSAIDAAVASDTNKIYQKYLAIEGKDVQKGLLKAKSLFDIYATDNQNMSKLTQIRRRLADKVHIIKMCSKPKQVLGGNAFGTPQKVENIICRKR